MTQQSAHAHNCDVGSAGKTTILVIDDDEGMREMSQETLQGAGYEVDVAESCNEGMRIFRQKIIDLAIVDIFLPEKDGLEELMEMRRNSQAAKVLAISGGGNIGFGQALGLAEKLGATATLAKPFRPDELLEKVREILEERNRHG